MFNNGDYKLINYEEYNIMKSNKKYTDFSYFDGLFFSINHNIILKNKIKIDMSNFASNLKSKFYRLYKDFLYFYYDNYKNIHILTPMSINDIIQSLEDICVEENKLLSEENKYYMAQFIHEYKNYR